MAVFENPSTMWFGTERKMQWIEMPQTGADASPLGASATSTLINGGGWTRNSWASHKQYEFSWGDSATRELANTIHAYANGTYGRGLIYFIDPMFAEINILPKWWADPSMALNYEAPSLVRGVQPTSIATDANTNDYPVDTVSYAVPANYDPQAERTEIAIPIPPGYSLLIGAAYSATGGAGIRVRDGVSSTLLPELSVTDNPIVTTPIAGEKIIYLGVVGDTTEQDVEISGIVARVVPTADTGLHGGGGWVSGEGHAGCRFDGKPTLISYTGLGGGQVGVAATLIEVGGWE